MGHYTDADRQQTSGKRGRSALRTVGLRGAALAAAVLGLALPSVASATPQISAPSATHVVPSFTFADVDPLAQSFVISRGSPDCSALTQIDGNASSPFTDPTLLADGSDDGSYCYQVQSFDGPDPTTSNPIDIGQATVVLDTAAPSLSPTLPANNAFVRGSVSVPYTADGTGTGITSVVLQVQQPGGGAWTTVDSGASPLAWNAPAEAAGDDAYGLRMVATDAAGNTTTVTRATVNTDNTAPSFSSGPSLPANNAFVRASVSVAYGATDGSGSGVSTVVLQVQQPGGGAWTTVDSGGSPLAWNTAAEAAGDDAYGLRIVATDAVGNAATVTRTPVNTDNTAPAFTAPGPTLPTNSTFVRGTVSVGFAATDGGSGLSSVALQVQQPGSGAWTSVDSGATPLAWDTTAEAAGDDSYGLRIVATDVAGNQTIVTRATIKVDNTAPSLVTISSPGDAATFGLGQINITYTGGAETASGNASGLSSVVLQTQNQSQVAGNTWTTRASSATTSSPAHWTPGAPDDCLCSFRLVATDNVGNQRISAAKTNIRIDGFPPLKPTLFKIDRAITNGPPILTWTASPSGDVVGYRLVRSRDQTVFTGPGGFLTGLTYTDNALLRDGSQDGANGYELYASDGNNLSPVMTVTFFLDTVSPTTPTAAHAVRRSGSTLVDLTWGASQDMLGNSVMTGVSRYIVRRAVGAAPTSPTTGESACDVDSSHLSCTDTSAGEGKTYFYSVFAVDAASNGSTAAHAGSVVIPDLTPPGQPTAFKVRKKGLVMAFTWNLPAAGDLNRVVIVRSTTRSPRSLTDGKVVFSAKVKSANVKQKAGTRAWYKAFAVDNAGNASASAGLQVVLPVFKLFPEDGSDLRTTRLTWKKSKRASYYNIQVYLGSKRITQAWPKGTSFKLPKSKLKKGKAYTWYVWPGIGAKARGRYGNLIGKSTFTWLG